MSILFKNAKLLTEEGELTKRDVLVENGIVKQISEEIADGAGDVIDCNGKLLSHGFIDLHVHLREPGGEAKETIATGTLAAAKGGFTTVASMPNTKPPIDTKEKMINLQKRIKETAKVRVLPYAAITLGQSGSELTDFDALKEEGAFAFTDDGVGVQSAGMMFQAMKKAAEKGYSIVAHCEDNTLINGGSFHDGVFAKNHGISGIPSVCESVQIARDVLLAEASGCHYHVCHISSKESVRAVRDAKKAGIRVTCEVTPHHLLLCDEDIPELNPNFKMNPPLRGREDKKALIEGLLDGTIDFIATDHAPHTMEEKSLEVDKAPFGIVGLETAFPLLYTYFVERGIFTLKQLVDWLTVKPARAFNLDMGELKEGISADLTLIDLQEEKRIDASTFASKGKNTPFNGWLAKGWPVLTMVDGKIVWKRGE